MSMLEFTKEVSQLIESQFPAIYREEGEELVAFLEAYYEFLQSDYRYSYKLGRSIFDIGDIDSSLDQFITNFKNTYLNDIPYDIVTDKRFAIKHINDYYRTKGSEQSLKLLMKILFNKEATVYNPGIDVLKPSESKWYKPVYLEVSASKRSSAFINKEITGSRSGAKAFVESVVRKRIKGKVFDVLYLSNVRGDFRTDERISNDGILEGAPKIIGSLTEVEVLLGGINNSIGDVFEVVTDQGVQGKVKVSGISDATGRVNFSVFKPGWGYTLDDTTDVYISDAILFVDNANTEFITYEKVYQPIERISVISSSDILGDGDLIGRYIIGVDSSNNYVANGVIVQVANTDGDGEVISEVSSNGVITILVNDGTFGDQKQLVLSSNALFTDNEIIDEESTYEVTVTGLSNTFSSGELVEQSVFNSYGDTVTGITSTLSTSNTTLIVSSTTGIIAGQPLTKTAGVGEFSPGTTVKRVIGEDQLVIDRLPLTSGEITFTAEPYSVRTSYAFGTYDSISNNVITLTGAFGTIDTSANTVIVGANSGATALPVDVFISSIGARGQVTSISGNTVNVNVIYGAFDANNAVRGSTTNVLHTISSVNDSGVSIVYLEANNNANGVLTSSNSQHVEGIVIGQNTTSIGVYGNTSPFFFSVANAYVSFVNTKRSELISPPRYANNEIIDLSKTITRVPGGRDATFEIGVLGDIEENVTLYTDLVGGTNIVGTKYLKIKLNGENSGFGFVSDMLISDGGTGYANNSRVSFSGGGFAGGNPISTANAFITTDGSGTITDITVDVNGSGYYETPTVILPDNFGGSDANVSVVMNYGYGFPKNPNAEYFNLIGDALNSTIANVGSIGLLTRINPGTQYTADPFVNVRNRYVAAYKRYDLVLVVNNISNGSFRVGEEIQQTVLSSTSIKGRIKAVDVVRNSGLIYLQRTSMSIAFSEGVKLVGSETGTLADLVSFYADESAPPIGENAVINANAISASGVATRLELVDSGFGYIDNEEITLDSIDGTNPFIITGITKVRKQGVGEGYWLSRESHLNSEKKIHDNKYYQEYSYEVLSELSLNRYETILKKVFHVAGTELFGSVVKVATIDMNSNIVISDITKSAIQTKYLVSNTGDNFVTKSGLYLTIRTEVEI